MKDWKPKWLEAYEGHGTVVAACRAVNISRDTAYRHRRSDPEFGAKWDELQNVVVAQIEQTLVEVALDNSRGSDQIRAAEIILKANRPGKYRESMKVEHGGTIRHEVDEALDDEINRFLAAHDQAGEVEDGRSDPSPALANGSEPGSDAA